MNRTVERIRDISKAGRIVPLVTAEPGAASAAGEALGEAGWAPGSRRTLGVRLARFDGGRGGLMTCELDAARPGFEAVGRPRAEARRAAAEARAPS